tara:strand:- start:1864 stop:2034 length:171 start_codon:yes stop_codon:yes gene_type:complete
MPKKVETKFEAYCLKCKAKHIMKNAKKSTLSNGRAAMKGVCPKCSTNMMLFVSNKK